MEKVSTFKDRLKEAMSDANLSQSDLARAIDCNRSVISYYLSGRNVANAKIHLKLSKILKVNPVWLEGYDVPKKTEKEIDLFYDKFNLLNDEGKKKVNIYMDDLLENPKYRKSDQSDPEHQLPKAKIA